MTSLDREWAALRTKLEMLEPLPFSGGEWSLLQRLHVGFNDRDAHTQLPLPIARFRPAAVREIFETARQSDELRTETTDDEWYRRKFLDGAPDPMAGFARRYGEEVDAMMRVLVPAARFRKGHYASGLFTAPEPHGLHTDHSAEDPGAAGEPICIARIETLGTHYLAGDYRAHDARMQSMLLALRHWTAVPEGEPEAIFDELLKQGALRSIPVNHVMLMVAGNRSDNAQITQHIAARPPEGGLHSAFFQRQYRLV